MKDSRSVLQAIREEKCPRCRQGDLFKSPAYNFSKFHQMYRSCSVCQQTFEPEPGFYIGAMFVSYAMVLLMSLLSWVVLRFAFNPAFAIYLIVIMILNVLFLPFIFRYSRTLYLFGVGGIRFNKDFQKSKT